MTLPLDTAPGPSPDEEAVRNAGISRELLAKARAELAAGDLQQASEKAWGAAAFALKAVAERRRWFNDADWKLGIIAYILSAELDDPSIAAGYSMTREAHYNFYHHEFGAWQIAMLIEAAARMLRNLEPALSPDYPPPFVSAEIEDAKRRLEQPTSKLDQQRLANGRPPMSERPPVNPPAGETIAENGAGPE